MLGTDADPFDAPNARIGPDELVKRPGPPFCPEGVSGLEPTRLVCPRSSAYMLRILTTLVVS